MNDSQNYINLFFKIQTFTFWVFQNIISWIADEDIKLLKLLLMSYSC